MVDFLVTPTNFEFLPALIKNPYSGRWTIPVLTFNTNYLNPYYSESDPLNKDPNYQKSLVDHFYVRLTEKWLYKDVVFRKLLKYFKVEKDGTKGTITLIDNPNKPSDSPLNEEYRKHIFKYIEKHFINKHFVDHVLRKYIKSTGMKWYDLFNNTSVLKELFAHKLKKLIVSTIYDAYDKKVDK